jgi:hypothetical protein
MLKVIRKKGNPQNERKYLQIVYLIKSCHGESTDKLKGSCSQNTLKNKRLEHWSYRQERNFIDRERLSKEMLSRVWKPGAS